ncbi:MAG: 1-deoxy-D-xylulose-5-phosphate reductoisomerase [Ruminococcaceae bacterium]|nr:1-deoxy-D-xylulose-5-phosphate reductoisomerase [Oscillospiraceae bacterium]
MGHNISVLGSTGSVGMQALDVARRCSYRVDALSTGKNIKLLEEQIREFKPFMCAVEDKAAAEELKKRISDTNVKVYAGADGICEMAEKSPSELVLNSIIGLAGLLPSMAVINSNKDLALANKESLVTAGDLVMDAVKRKGVKLLPVDSEHSAIFQCLEGNIHNKIKRILLTASGGPFFGRKREELSAISAAEALAHPTWKMGKKITVDSATLLNKGFEIIEAVHLFGVPVEKVEVVVHRESVIHSMVEFEDNAVIAQLGTPDMRTCIQYAVTYPNRVDFGTEPLDLKKIGTLSFYEPDGETFSLLECAKKAIKKGGTVPAALNASNEVAVAAFLEGKIGFTDIFDIVSKVVDEIERLPMDSIESVLKTDKEARRMAYELI